MRLPTQHCCKQDSWYSASQQARVTLSPYWSHLIKMSAHANLQAEPRKGSMHWQTLCFGALHLQAASTSKGHNPDLEFGSNQSKPLSWGIWICSAFGSALGQNHKLESINEQVSAQSSNPACENHKMGFEFQSVLPMIGLRITLDETFYSIYSNSKDVMFPQLTSHPTGKQQIRWDWSSIHGSLQPKKKTEITLGSFVRMSWGIAKK